MERFSRYSFVKSILRLEGGLNNIPDNNDFITSRANTFGVI